MVYFYFQIRLIVIDTFTAHFRDLKGYEKIPKAYELTSVLGSLAQDYVRLIRIKIISMLPFNIFCTSTEYGRSSYM